MTTVLAKFDPSDGDQTPLHRFRNGGSAVALGNPAWTAARNSGLIDIRCDYKTPNVLRRLDGHEFVNLCSCSYLGLHSHPEVLEGAIQAIREVGAMDLPISRIRLRLNLLEDMEEQLSVLMGVRTISAVTSSAATSGVLPLIASGHMFGGEPPVMVFDKFCHFSMDYIKPICGDETTVLTGPHNDMNFLEDVCRRHSRVAYVCDGVYSMGGAAPIHDLLALQERYGLFLFIDDSHSLSLHGRHGRGFARSVMPEVDERTIIIASLGKGFGGSGGIVMLGPKAHEDLMTRFGGPLAWSQGLNVPGIGAAMGSIKVHNSPELPKLQQRLADNMALFDSLVHTGQSGNGFPLKVIRIGDEQTSVHASASMLDRGYYTSAVFFPIVRRGEAGLRIMLRADNCEDDIRGFAAALSDVLQRDVSRPPEGFPETPLRAAETAKP
jgi:7-keto-8-aminopelargonate synthetase-like enzyme